MLQAVRASPGSKAATLSKDSQALTHAVRAQLDSQCMQGDAEVRPSFALGTACLCAVRSLVWEQILDIAAGTRGKSIKNARRKTMQAKPVWFLFSMPCMIHIRASKSTPDHSCT